MHKAKHYRKLKPSKFKDNAELVVIRRMHGIMTCVLTMGNPIYIASMVFTESLTLYTYVCSTIGMYSRELKM